MVDRDGLFPEPFDPIYFRDASWAERVDLWVQAHVNTGFAAGNVEVVEQVLADEVTGLRMVVNITADALLGVLRDGSYHNLYENPVIGGSAKEPTDERRKVDETFDLTDNHYFGAAALGGAGVRFYGEYCMVIKLERVSPSAASRAPGGGRTIPDTRLLDRDSYDILLQPLSALQLSKRQVERLTGTWDADVLHMALLRVLPEIGHDMRLATSGTISEAVLRDQEFIEVHLKGSFGPPDLEEVRESPDDAALELAIAERARHGLFTTMVDREWARRRAVVARELDRQRVRHRVVTLHGRGYQWK
jgi:hypothetical protein